MTTFKDATDIIDSLKDQPVEDIKAILSNFFSKDISNDLRVLIEMNTLLIDCHGHLSENPNYIPYLKIQQKLLKFYLAASSH